MSRSSCLEPIQPEDTQAISPVQASWNVELFGKFKTRRAKNVNNQSGGAGNDRVKVSDIRVSNAASSGMSFRFTGGRKMEDMFSGMALRMSFWGFTGDPATVGMMKVMKRRRWRSSR
ncbi:hypothetical protein R6Q59_011081, partial [Mikania micrantha]